MPTLDTTVPPSISFASLQLAAPIQRALADKGYTQPSPIQAQAIPPLLEGRDLIGVAQTGTGKTAAFALPMLHRLAAKPQPRLARRPRGLILTPTRELAVQIADNFALYGRGLPLRSTLVFGGVGENPQIRGLAAGTDIVIATPGRLLDLLERNFIALDRIEIFVLDEADRMLDMGFAPAVKRILAKLPPHRQSLLFSATMPESIRSLAHSFLRDPVQVTVAPVSSTAERIDQQVCHVDRGNKQGLLVHLLQKHNEGLVLVFAKTKHGADRLVRNLNRDGITAEAIHGNKSQGARQRALENFRTGRARILIATDIAARGIDVKGIELVINYDLPNESESYVHRIGRTARAGADGLAISLCDETERGFLRSIQRLIRQEIPVLADHPFCSAKAGGSRPKVEHRGSEREARGAHSANSQHLKSNAHHRSGRGDASRSHPSAQAPRQAQSPEQGRGTQTARPYRSRFWRSSRYAGFTRA